jgi:hypothetical protein
VRGDPVGGGNSDFNINQGAFDHNNAGPDDIATDPRDGAKVRVYYNGLTPEEYAKQVDEMGDEESDPEAEAAGPSVRVNAEVPGFHSVRTVAVGPAFQIDPAALARFGKGFDGPGLRRTATAFNRFALVASVVVAAPVAGPLAVNSPRFIASVGRAGYVTALSHPNAIVNVVQFAEALALPGAAVASNPAQLYGNLISILNGDP